MIYAIQEVMFSYESVTTGKIYGVSKVQAGLCVP